MLCIPGFPGSLEPLRRGVEPPNEAALLDPTPGEGEELEPADSSTAFFIASMFAASRAVDSSTAFSTIAAFIAESSTTTRAAAASSVAFFTAATSVAIFFTVASLAAAASATFLVAAVVVASVASSTDVADLPPPDRPAPLLPMQPSLGWAVMQWSGLGLAAPTVGARQRWTHH
jgi:hypothetical protein